MNSNLKIRVKISTVLLGLATLTGLVRGQEPYIAEKIHLYTQTIAAGAVAHPTTPYAFRARSGTTGVTLHLPGGATQALPFVAGENSYQVATLFASKTALDVAYPAGTYTMTATGLPTLTFNLANPELFPPAIPQITNGTWNSGGLLVVDPTQSYTFNLSTFSTYASAGVAGHMSFDLDTNTSGFQQEIATQAVLGLTASPTPFTSVTIPANTLTAGGVFRLELTFDSLSTLDTTTVPGNGVVALYQNHLEVWVAAVAAATPALPIPVFTVSPANRTATLGGSATFSATMNFGGNPQNFRFFWYLNGLEVGDGSDPRFVPSFNNNIISLTVTGVTANDVGNYTLKVIDYGGMATSGAASLTIVASSVPTITTQPQGHTVAAGSSVVFGVEAAGGGLIYQWKKNGVPILGATANQLLLTNAQGSDAASYTLTASNGSGSVTSTAAVLAVVSTGDPGRLINVAVRIVSGTDANVLIMGFVLGGNGTSGTKTLLARGVGPTLTGFGVPGAMVDPLLQIIPGGGATPTASNDNWAGDATVTATANAVGAFALPDANSKDSALVTSLAGGVWSSKVSGVNNTTGTVLAEVYDANAATFNPTTPRLVNISARAPMANDNPLIAGFVIGGSTAKTLMIRAIGPYLSQFFGAAAMSDPKLELHIRQGSNDTVMTSNDNWGGAAMITTTGNSVGAFPLSDANSKDAVLLVTLDPGVYSANVSGVNNASGITLVEIYEVP